MIKSIKPPFNCLTKNKSNDIFFSFMNFKLQIFNFRVKTSSISSNNQSSKENFSQSKGKEKAKENSIQTINTSPNSSNIYHAKTEVDFQSGKFSVIQTDRSIVIKLSKIHKVLINSVCILGGACAIGSLLCKSYMLFCVSGVATFIAIALRSILLGNLSRLTKELNLIDDGKNVEIVTFTKRFIVELNSIKAPNAMQAITLNKLNPDVANLNIPYVVDRGPHRGFYYIPPSNEIGHRKDLLLAILNKDAIIFCNKNKKSE